MLGRFALRLAYSADPRQRWRQVGVAVSSAVSVVLLLLGLSVVHAAHEGAQVRDLRAPTYVSSGESVRFSLRGPIAPDGQQYSMVWIEPAKGHEQDPSIIPPGLSRLPAPGEVVLSPGLQAAGISAADLGMQKSQAGAGADGAIGDAGLVTRSEYLAYARPAPGRSLGTGGALQTSSGYGGIPSILIEADEELPTFKEAIVGSTWLLWGPAMLVLVSGARAFSELRSQRAATLHRLGVARRKIRVVALLETMALAAPAALLAGVVWLLLSRETTEIPGTPLVLKAHSLAVGVGEVGAVVVGAVLIAGIAGAAGGIAPVARVRPATSRSWRVIPLCLAFGSLLAVGVLPPGDGWGSMLLFGGMVAAFVAVPLALPFLTQWLGQSLAPVRSAVGWLVGRRLATHAPSFARPAAVVALVVCISGGAVCVASAMEGASSKETSQVAGTLTGVGWRSPDRSDVADVQRAFEGTAVVLPVTQTPAGPRAFLPDCRKVEAQLASLGDSPCAGKTLSPSAKERLLRSTGAHVVVGHPPKTTVVQDVLIVSSATLTSTQVMSKVGGLPAVDVTPAQNTTPHGSVSPWLLVGMVFASVAFALAMTREMGDRILHLAGWGQRMRRLGLSPGEVRRTELLSLLTPMVVAIPLGLAFAFTFGAMGTGLDLTLIRVDRLLLSAASAGGLAMLLAVVLSLYVGRSRVDEGVDTAELTSEPSVLTGARRP